MDFLGFLVFCVGAIGVLLGGLWFLVEAFQENVLLGLLCIFFPPLQLIFLLFYWNKAGKPFLIQLAGIVVIVAGVLMVGAQVHAAGVLIG